MTCLPGLRSTSIAIIGDDIVDTSIFQLLFKRKTKETSLKSTKNQKTNISEHAEQVYVNTVALAESPAHVHVATQSSTPLHIKAVVLNRGAAEPLVPRKL